MSRDEYIPIVANTSLVFVFLFIFWLWRFLVHIFDFLFVFFPSEVLNGKCSAIYNEVSIKIVDVVFVWHILTADSEQLLGHFGFLCSTGIH